MRWPSASPRVEVPWAAYLPELHDVMDAVATDVPRPTRPADPAARPWLGGEARERHRVADVACGSGNGTIVMARRFPRSTFVGYDQDAAAIAVARSRARGLANVSFEAADAATLTTDQPFGVAFVFTAVHDQARPLEVLTSIRSLEPGGTLRTSPASPATSRTTSTTRSPR